MPDTPVSEKSIEEEFYSAFPEGYRIGRTKYIIVIGSVMSGVGKGTFSSSLGMLLGCYGFNVAPIKFDGYLNYDAGTLNPYRHGEVFVLDDGTECDLDLGTYERCLNKNLTKDNYLTSGRIFKSIIDKERNGQYMGRDVQFIPHVTGEIKSLLRELSMKSDADIVLVEVGGTVGDLENSYFIEAMRELRHEEGDSNFCAINIAYILQPQYLGESKSKPAQLGTRKLMELGIRPDIVVCRSETPINKSIKEKISLFSDVDVGRIYNLWETRNIYEIPLMLRDMGMDNAVFDVLQLTPKTSGDPSLSKWREFTDKVKSATKEVVIGVVGKYTQVHDSYLSIIKALEHAAPYSGARARIAWIEATDIEDKKLPVQDALKGVNGMIIPGGFGKRGIEGKIAAIRYARENRLPFLGLCLGMQLAVVEFSRNVCNLDGADSTEFNAGTKHPVIDFIPEQVELVKQSKYGGTMRRGAYTAILQAGTLASRLYGSDSISERHRHRYEVNPKYVGILEKGGLVFSGRSPDGKLMEFLELKEHPFFIATQAHPEFKSRPLNPAPLFRGLVEASLQNERAR
jgi:CTP synthase